MERILAKKIEMGEEVLSMTIIELSDDKKELILTPYEHETANTIYHPVVRIHKTAEGIYHIKLD